MQLEVGAVLEGKITGITKFGAFVELPGGRTGMVHISELPRPTSRKSATMSPKTRRSRSRFSPSVKTARSVFP